MLSELEFKQIMLAAKFAASPEEGVHMLTLTDLREILSGYVSLECMVIPRDSGISLESIGKLCGKCCTCHACS